MLLTQYFSFITSMCLQNITQTPPVVSCCGRRGSAQEKCPTTNIVCPCPLIRPTETFVERESRSISLAPDTKNPVAVSVQDLHNSGSEVLEHRIE